MTLSRQLIYKTAVLTAGLALLGGASLWGLGGLQAGLHRARNEYRALRMVQAVSIHAAAAKGLLRHPNPDRAELSRELRRASECLAEFSAQEPDQRDAVAIEQEGERRAVSAISRALTHITEQVELAGGEPLSPEATANAVKAISAASGVLDWMVARMDESVAEAQEQTHARVYATMVALAVLSFATLGAAVLIGVSQYRSVMKPLRRLREGVRKIASGDFSERVATFGPGEFRDLSTDFNDMAEQLHELYTDLEARVRSKSNELVKSERLASVGFLAAGVAHEINNPLNIISGYAELTLKRLANCGDSSEVEEANDSLRIIRDEAFRCKDIIDKLLSLARNGSSARSSVSLGGLVQDVASLVQGLKQYRDRRLTIHLDKNADLVVNGNDNELKQVLLNLTLNALQAVDPQDGEVRIECKRNNGWVEVRVVDNGCGMSEETREHVFEPFFTERRDTVERGVGLGLSITHAIVESHGGQLRAHSDGVGRGSCFTVQFRPATGFEADDRQTT